MKVRIVKAGPECWYGDQIGSIFAVKKTDTESLFEVLSGGRTFDRNPLAIYKEDCEILPEENQPEPFDLGRALNGEKVVTRSGIEVEELHFFKTAIQSHYCISALIFGDILKFLRDGKFMMNKVEHEYDLFMAPRPFEYMTVWVNIRNEAVSPNAIHCSHAYNTFEKAEQAAEYLKNDNTFIGTFPITFKLPS